MILRIFSALLQDNITVFLKNTEFGTRYRQMPAQHHPNVVSSTIISANPAISPTVAGVW